MLRSITPKEKTMRVNPPQHLVSGTPTGERGASTPLPMLVPSNAWRILNARTGGAVSRPTFYRWLSNGKVFSIRLGHRLYIPWPVVSELISQCLSGARD